VLPCLKDLVANEKILQLNERLKAEAKRSNIIFIDVYSSLIDKNGEQIPAMFLTDGIHLSAFGYMTWVEILKPFIFMKFSN
jgi:lysophospholipase L1-like esterase